MPSSHLYTIESDEIDGRTGKALFYRMRSGKCPPCLDDSQIDQRIKVRARVTPWDNAIGGFMDRVRPVFIDSAEGAS